LSFQGLSLGDDVGVPGRPAILDGGGIPPRIADDLIQGVLIPEKDPELDHPSEDQHEHGNDEGELYEGLPAPAVSAARATAGIQWTKTTKQACHPEAIMTKVLT
jgi:hypothetical protein